MINLSRIVLSTCVCLGSSALSGCNRTSDGTVIIPERMDMRRFWQGDGYAKASNGSAPQAIFPSPPNVSGVAAEMAPPPARRTPRTNNAEATLDTVSFEPQKQLSCKNVSQPSGRAKMVCD